mmetsp:Transcript_80586/g.261092  ORF Transcript_80586/g.261092 Transcript_80586/m.261092 type:complete len:218 (+) Transcript_80586:1206-1859(+)
MPRRFHPLCSFSVSRSALMTFAWTPQNSLRFSAIMKSACRPYAMPSPPPSSSVISTMSSGTSTRIDIRATQASVQWTRMMAGYFLGILKKPARSCGCKAQMPSSSISSVARSTPRVQPWSTSGPPTGHATRRNAPSNASATALPSFSFAATSSSGHFTKGTHSFSNISSVTASTASPSPSPPSVAKWTSSVLASALMRTMSMSWQCCSARGAYSRIT